MARPFSERLRPDPTMKAAIEEPAPPDQPKSALISLLCELGGDLRELNLGIGVLSDALEPVLRAEGPKPAFPPAEVAPDTSLAVRHCLDLQTYIAQLRARIQDLSRRVE